MKILIACEESQVVTLAFRERGHEAFSCDLQECSGGHSEWHYRCDVREIMYERSWDMIIAHPPCTYLAKVQLWRCLPGTERHRLQQEAIKLVDQIYNCGCPAIAIENPPGKLGQHGVNRTEEYCIHTCSGTNIRKRSASG